LANRKVTPEAIWPAVEWTKGAIYNSRSLMNHTLLLLCKIWDFTAVTMKYSVFWDVAPCRYCANQRFGGTYRLHIQGKRISERGTSLSRCSSSSSTTTTTNNNNNNNTITTAYYYYYYYYYYY
jgi:hypothetical protein